MKLFAATLFATSLVGCSTGAPVDNEQAWLSDSARVALAEYGITNVEGSAASFDLYDASDRIVGHVSFDRGYTSATFRGNRVETHIEDGALTIACNGNGASLAGGSAAGLEVLEPCRDARRIAAIVGGAESFLEEQQQVVGDLCELMVDVGCVNWNAEQGCVTMQICFVYACIGGIGTYACFEY